MARKYAVQFDEGENRSKIVVWDSGVAAYIDMQGQESGRAEAVTYTQAKREVLADRVRVLEGLTAEVKALRSQTKTTFDATWDKHEADMAAYQAGIDAEIREQERADAEYAAKEMVFETTLPADMDADDKRMAVFLWRYGYWDQGWRPWGSRGATLEVSNGFQAMVHRNTSGDWSATVWADGEETTIGIAAGGLPVGFAWVDKHPERNINDTTGSTQ